MSLSPAEFDYLRALLRQKSSMVLEDGKTYLADARLMALARREGYPTASQLMEELRTGRGRSLTRKVVEAMTVNETSFFRDIQPFDALRQQLLPELVRRRASERRLRIWSAACSTGQEPYTLAMVVHEFFAALPGWNVSILGTDLCKEMVDRSREARFCQAEINRGLPARLLVKYFQQDGAGWQVRDVLRNLVEFRMLNLAQPWPLIEPMDIIFLRNVLIYFDVPTKKEILGRVRKVLRPDGYLFLGGAETPMNLDEAFERVSLERAGCYRIKG